VTMRILIMGGTGALSSAVSAEAVAQGWEVTLAHRGRSSNRDTATGTNSITVDVRDRQQAAAAFAGERWDVVIDFIGYLPEHVELDIDLFAGRVGQYVFISTAATYQRPPARLPITESTPLSNPFSAYGRAKIACEELLNAAYRDSQFPMTIIRPSHTYDATRLPLYGGWTAFDRMLRGAPSVVHGDGTSLWTLTHARDFASALVALLGRRDTLGHAFTITSDEVLTWDAIYREVGTALGVEPSIVHVTSDTIARIGGPAWADDHLGDRAHSLVFDTGKLRQYVPGWTPTTTFAEGVREMVAWYDAHPEEKRVDPEVDAVLDRLAATVIDGWEN
jgi:nucleoside-diphosphate-sugar epimerase